MINHQELGRSLRGPHSQSKLLDRGGDGKAIARGKCGQGVRRSFRMTEVRRSKIEMHIEDACNPGLINNLAVYGFR